jgi:nucleotidyltransferase/DNA polymerase involved in DNA repair
LAGEAVAVCEGSGSTSRVVAASRLARRSGVKAGTTLAQARVILPSLIARGRDPACERSASEALMEVAWSLSPQVEAATQDLVYADVGGMERMYPGAAGERDMAQAVVVAAEAFDLIVRVGVAGNKLAARIAARQPDSPTVVPSGEEARFLAPLPIRELDLDRRLAATLFRWGITTVGELARLPADRVASRLGDAGADAHRAACGVDPGPLVPYRLPDTISESLELEWPVVTVEPLLYAVGQSLERARRRLERQDLACTLLELELGLEPEGLALVRLEVEARPPRAPVGAFACVLHPDRPRRGQLSLFGAPEIHPDRLAATLARLQARLGPEQVGSPRPVDGHLPERFGNRPFDPPPAPKLRRAAGHGRGLLVVRVLRPPVGLEVTVEEGQGAVSTEHVRPPSPEGRRADAQERTFNPRLISIASVTGATPRVQGLVRVAAGPWSLEEGWWRGEPVERDYWDVELSGGGLYRIYRDRRTGDWFADGMYD